MELWIRSQRNEKLRDMLCKVEEIEIGDYDEEMDCIVVNNLHCVGIYKTKERALEILDEIESILCFKRLEQYSADAIINVDNNIAIYEMPKE